MSSLSGKPSKRRLAFAVLAVVLMATGIAEMAQAIWNVPRNDGVDFRRQWIVWQYVNRRVNPYPVALAALRARYPGRIHLRNTYIGTIPHTGPDPNTDPRFGPPETTYPPTTTVAFAFIAGHFPLDKGRFTWLFLNIALLPLIFRELWLLFRERDCSWLLPFSLAAVMLAWPCTPLAVEYQQYSLPVLCSVLMATRIMGTRPVTAGFLYCVALIKPSLAIPFLLLPLAQKRWKVFAVMAAVESALLLAASLALHELPWVLLKQWLSVAGYFLQGLYTVQDVINGLHFDGTPVGTLIPMLILAAAFWAIRRMEPARAIAFAAVIATVWMYHNPYDFVALLLPAALLTKQLLREEKAEPWMFAVLVAFIVLGVALTGRRNTHHPNRSLGGPPGDAGDCCRLRMGMAILPPQRAAGARISIRRRLPESYTVWSL